MAEAVVSVALETLGNLLIQEATFLRGVKDQVKGLQTEFGNLQSLLKDADRKQHDSETIRNWIKDIRHLAYRAEDVLEEYVIKAAGGSGKGDGFLGILKRFVCFANEMGTLHNIGSEIETIKSHINILTEKMDKFGIEAIIRRDDIEDMSTSDENKRRFIRKTYAHEELQHFVGMDGDIEKLVSLLISDQESRRPVIGVWGMGGSGKTSVANKVYKHVDVKGYFDSFAWVCITQKCQMESVMQDIFRQLLPSETNRDTIDELVEQIYKVQMENRCLIVVDDIWKLDDWKLLAKCFPNVGISHSKVLLTTRNKKVAEIGYPIQLKGITEDEAWKLLSMKAFAKTHFQESWDDSEYEKLGRKMIRKCERLPLAVAVLGGILSGKNSLEEWKLASEDVNSYIGRGTEGTGEQGEVEKVLALSYDELPYHLKPCFLSLGFLREDESIFVESIYDLWMAQGLIQSKHVGRNETMRDVAKYYFSELQFRSMVMLHNLSRVSLHDSILELCLSKAKEEEFLKVVEEHNSSDKAYRLVAYVDGEDNYLDVLKAIENSITLRSLHIIHKQVNSDLILPKEIFNLPHFKSLRTLIIYRCYLRGKCFHGIENLIHLRLLGLAGCEWENLSLESVDKLSFLQTLILTGTTLTSMNLPPLDTFCKMPQLRHLYLPKLTYIAQLETKVRMRLMNLSQLECLYGFQSKFFDLKDVSRLETLRTLRDCEVNDDESLVHITDYICGSNLRWIDISIQICDLNGQQESEALRKLLNMSNVTLELRIRSCELSKLPRLETTDFSNMCPGLVHLTLEGIQTYIAEDVMQALDKFPNLKRLELHNVRFGGEEMICGPGSFPRLEKLDFYLVAGKFELRIDEAAMPNLSTMVIFNCYGINFMIPQRLRLFAQMEHCNSCVFN